MEAYDEGVSRPTPAPKTAVTESLGRMDGEAFDQFWRALSVRPHAFFRRAAGGPSDLRSWSFLASNPVEIVTSSDGRPRVGNDPFRALARRWPSPVRQKGPKTPFTGGFAGFIGYEARSAVERTPPPRRAPDGFPTYWLGRYDAVLALDHRTGRAFVSGVGETVARARTASARLLARARAPAAPKTPARTIRSRAPRSVVSAAAYRRRVAEVRRRIGAGDLFQANLSQRFEGSWTGSAARLFDRLTAASPTPFSTFLALGDDRTILSTSPERFLERSGDRLETRPMKGTRRRGDSPTEDRTLARELRTSEKDRAELAMIVDLARNDLAHACRPGTVRVESPRQLERYATVHQAVGVVSGRLAPDVHPAEAVRRAFPPGSVTGAPKVEAMNVIDALEGEGRGPYCGAIGWFDEGGDFDLAVAIRTVCLVGRNISYRVGGGVTWLSDPEEERVETVDKGAAIARAITLGRRS